MQGSCFGQGYGLGITVMTETPEIERTGFNLNSSTAFALSAAIARISELLGGLDSPNSRHAQILAEARSLASAISPAAAFSKMARQASSKVLATRFPQNNVMDLGKCFMKSIILIC